jgi:hypothetical protein
MCAFIHQFNINCFRIHQYGLSWTHRVALVDAFSQALSWQVKQLENFKFLAENYSNLLGTLGAKNLTALFPEIDVSLMLWIIVNLASHFSLLFRSCNGAAEGHQEGMIRSVVAYTFLIDHWRRLCLCLSAPQTHPAMARLDKALKNPEKHGPSLAKYRPDTYVLSLSGDMSWLRWVDKWCGSDWLRVWISMNVKTVSYSAGISVVFLRIWQETSMSLSRKIPTSLHPSHVRHLL